VSWATSANGSMGCGGLTGATPLPLVRPWIAETARKLGSQLIARTAPGEPPPARLSGRTQSALPR
jgi:hypothetical protein